MALTVSNPLVNMWGKLHRAAGFDWPVSSQPCYRRRPQSSEVLRLQRTIPHLTPWTFCRDATHVLLAAEVLGFAVLNAACQNESRSNPLLWGLVAF